MVFYYDKEKAEQGILFCLGQENKILTQEEIIEQGKEDLYSNSVYYESEYIFLGHPIVEGNKVRPATYKELVELGKYELREGEILDGDELVTINRPSWKYKWDGNQWIVDEDLLEEGEIIVSNSITKVEPSEDLYYPVWDKNLKEWVESEDVISVYHKDIDKYKEMILADGFVFTDDSNISHRQKARLTDKINLEIVISSLGDENLSEVWYFDVNDAPNLTIEELTKMRNDGVIFNRAVFFVENILKKMNPSKEVTLDYFKNEIDKISSIKCYRE